MTPEVRKARQRERWAAAIEVRRERTRTPEFKEAQYFRRILRELGITKEQYHRMLTAQNGVCAICGGIDASGRRLCIDHDHRTGKIRGLLCNNCNGVLGYLNDNPILLREMLRYLRTHSG